jgi:hypothetical protein
MTGQWKLCDLILKKRMCLSSRQKYPENWDFLGLFPSRRKGHRRAGDPSNPAGGPLSR